MNKDTNKSIEKTAMLICGAIFLVTMIGAFWHLSLFHMMDKGTFNWFDHMFEEPKMNFNGGLFNDFMTLVSTYGDVVTFVIMTVVVAVALLIKRYYLIGLWLLATVGLGGILGIIFKDLIHRARPYDHLLADTGFSFPSGHSLSSTLIVIILFTVFIPNIRNKAVKVIVTLLIFVLWISILFSRMYFHAHFLTDVVGGVSLGITWVMASILIFRACTPMLSKLPLLRKGKIFNVK
ncbi:phosphatase PAP2 family protein [Staphylococcus carnosus]|uniref:phosphatase PAP2 family protein n=1 Tax=Staphylococcus carnosus TaxID=1281 RepID=UPI0020A36F4B|nr:phosphatase PAP2 family protein [Staphylococcus carnosus]UTB81447.1 PA-phosphatase [Staphylococcus carnosus]